MPASSRLSPLSLRVIIPLLFGMMIAALSLAPSAYAVAPPNSCTNLQGQVVCVVDVIGSVGSNVEIAGTNLDAAIEVELVFSDGTSRTYYKPPVSNPAGSTVKWAVVTTVTRAQLNSMQTTPGFAKQAEHELGMSPVPPATTGPATGTGQAIKIQDDALGGKTITGVNLYDVTRSRASTSLAVVLGGSGKFVPPTLTFTPVSPTKLVVSSPSGLNQIDRFDFTCACTNAAGQNISVIRINRLTGTNIGVTAGTITWSDTQVTFESTYLPGYVIPSIQVRKGVESATYTPNPAIYFTPLLTSAVATGNSAEYKLSGGNFLLLRHMIVTFENGTTRLVALSGSGSDDNRISVQTFGRTTITIKDTAAIGHTITKLDLYYRDSNGQETLVISRDSSIYIKGEITGLSSEAAASATLSGLGLQAVVSVVFTLSDGSTLTFNQGEFDEQSFDRLTITDSQLSGVSIMSVTATASDGQTMSFTPTNGLLIGSLGPRFEVYGPDNGENTGPYPIWYLTSTDVVDQYLCSVDGADAVQCTGDNYSYIYLYNGLSDGPHSLVISAVSGTGTTTKPARTFNVVQPPNVQFTSPTDGQTFPSGSNIELAWEMTGGAVDSMTCSLYHSSLGYQTIPCGSSPQDLGVLPDGYAYVQFEMYGPGGGAYPYVYFYIGDPVTLNINDASVTGANGAVSAEFTATNAIYVQCYLYGNSSGYFRSIYPCSSPATFSNVPVGDYTLEIYAGNSISSASDSVQVTVRQELSVTIVTPASGAAVRSSGTNFRYQLSEPAQSVACMLDGAAIGCGTASQLDFTGSLGSLSDGSHTLLIAATSTSGVDKSASVTFTSYTPPTVSITSPTEGQNFTSSSGLTASFVLGGGAATSVTCEVRSGSESGSFVRNATACTSPYDMSGLAEQPTKYYLIVRASGASGSPAIASVSFKVFTPLIPSSVYDMLYLAQDNAAGGGTKLFKIKPDGTGAIELDKPAGLAYHGLDTASFPAYSPDHTMIATGRGIYPSGYGVYVSDGDGHNVTHVINTSSAYEIPRDVRFSKDGTMISYTRGNGAAGGIFVADISAAGGTFTVSNIRRVAAPSGNFGGYDFSPDSTKIVYSSGASPAQLFTVGVSGSATPVRISNFTSTNVPVDPTWMNTPYGERIAYSHQDAGSIGRELWTITTAGAVQRLTTSGFMGEFTPSPDGSLLVFRTGQDYLAKVNTNGSGYFVITYAPRGWQNNCSFNVEGTWVVCDGIEYIPGFGNRWQLYAVKIGLNYQQDPYPVMVAPTISQYFTGVEW